MRLYITRHSRTIWNEEKRLQGWKDSDLTIQGIEDAKALKEYLKNIKIDMIYTSPLKRALETTKILSDDYLVDDRLKEMNFGDFEGQEISKLKETKEYNDLWNHPSKDLSLPNGETYQEVNDRIINFINEIYNSNKNKSVLIVIHGFLFVVLLGYIKGLKIEELNQINDSIVRGCSLTSIDYDGKEFKINYIGKDDYLPTLNQTISYK